MKKNQKSLLLAALGATLLVGCATSNENTRASLPSGYVRSQLTVSPLTNPAELVKWTQFNSSLKASPMLRSIETYAFAAPADPRPADRSAFVTSMPPGTVFVEPAGAGADADQAFILHTPGQR